MPCARSAAGSAALTSPRPPVLVSGAHSGVTKRTRIKKDPGRGTGVGFLHTPEGREVRMQGGKVGRDAALAAHLRRWALAAQLVHRQGGHFVLGAAEFVAHRDVETCLAIVDLGAERSDPHRLLLRGIELNEANHPTCAAD